MNANFGTRTTQGSSSLFASVAPPITVAEIFGALVLDGRKRLGLSQGDLARSRGRTQTWLSYIENGQREPSLGDLDYLCDRLAITFPLSDEAEDRGREIVTARRVIP